MRVRGFSSWWSRNIAARLCQFCCHDWRRRMSSCAPLIIGRSSLLGLSRRSCPLLAAGRALFEGGVALVGFSVGHSAGLLSCLLSIGLLLRSFSPQSLLFVSQIVFLRPCRSLILAMMTQKALHRVPTMTQKGLHRVPMTLRRSRPLSPPP